MFGWLVYKKGVLLTAQKRAEYETITLDELIVAYRKYPKFENEQLFSVSEECLLLTEGVLLNAGEIKAETKSDSLRDALFKLFSRTPHNALVRLNGPFCGVYHDRTENRTHIFTNRIGDRPVYYYQSGNHRIASSNINLLIAFCHENALTLTFDQAAGNMMLELGFMADNCTMAREIKRVFPGECLIWEKVEQRTEQYYMYDNTCDDSITLNDAIETVDRLFRQAVGRCFDKDKEYGYHHVADLSGGLDSRMTTWVARDMGYGPFLNLNWGMSCCEDYKIAAKVAAYLGNDFIFESLDNMNCFYDLDEAVRRNFGAAIYIGPTGALRFAKNIRSELFGLKHSGQLGDVIVGSFVYEIEHKKPNENSVFGYACVNNCRVPYENYQNVEQARYYVRGFLGVTNASQLQNEYWIVTSPFLDNDLMEYCLKIPLKYRVNHYLYVKWIEAKYPAVLKFRRQGSLLSVRNTYLHPKVSSFVNRAFNRFKRDSQTLKYKLKLSQYRYRLDVDGMNPLDAVFERDGRLPAYMQDYFDKSIGLFEGDKVYQHQLMDTFHKGKVAVKAMVLTVLSFVKQHKIEVNAVEQERFSQKQTR